MSDNILHDAKVRFIPMAQPNILPES